MIRAIAFGFSMLAAGPAAALSCLQPTVEGAYRVAQDSPADYVIGIGSLTAAGPSNPPEGAVAVGGDINAMQGFTQPAVFNGSLFTGTGFNTPGNFAVTAEVTCVAAWCGSYSNASNALFFFRREASGAHILELGACPGFVFDSPTQAQRQAVIACYQNGGC